MEITVISIVLGVVISAACIGLPHLVRVLTQKPDDDSKGYLEQTGRSASEVDRENAVLLAEEQEARGSSPAADADGSSG